MSKYFLRLELVSVTKHNFVTIDRISYAELEILFQGQVSSCKNSSLDQESIIFNYCVEFEISSLNYLEGNHAIVINLLECIKLSPTCRDDETFPVSCTFTKATKATSIIDLRLAAIHSSNYISAELMPSDYDLIDSKLSGSSILYLKLSILNKDKELLPPLSLHETERISQQIDIYQKQITRICHENYKKAKQWLYHLKQLYPWLCIHDIKLLAQDETDQHRFVNSFLGPIYCSRDIVNIRSAARFVSLLPYKQTLSLIGNNHLYSRRWKSAFTTLSSYHGDIQDHAILLCNLLLGWGMNAYIAFGTIIQQSNMITEATTTTTTTTTTNLNTDNKSKKLTHQIKKKQDSNSGNTVNTTYDIVTKKYTKRNHIWVITTDTMKDYNKVIFWEPLTGQQYDIIVDNQHNIQFPNILQKELDSARAQSTSNMKEISSHRKISVESVTVPPVEDKEYMIRHAGAHDLKNRKDDSSSGIVFKVRSVSPGMIIKNPMPTMQGGGPHVRHSHNTSLLQASVASNMKENEILHENISNNINQTTTTTAQNKDTNVVNTKATNIQKLNEIIQEINANKKLSKQDRLKKDKEKRSKIMTKKRDTDEIVDTGTKNVPITAPPLVYTLAHPFYEIHALFNETSYYVNIQKSSVLQYQPYILASTTMDASDNTNSNTPITDNDGTTTTKEILTQEQIQEDIKHYPPLNMNIKNIHYWSEFKLHNTEILVHPGTSFTLNKAFLYELSQSPIYPYSNYTNDGTTLLANIPMNYTTMNMGMNNHIITTTTTNMTTNAYIIPSDNVSELVSMPKPVQLYTINDLELYIETELIYMITRWRIEYNLNTSLDTRLSQTLQLALISYETERCLGIVSSSNEYDFQSILKKLITKGDILRAYPTCYNHIYLPTIVLSLKQNPIVRNVVLGQLKTLPGQYPMTPLSPIDITNMTQTRFGIRVKVFTYGTLCAVWVMIASCTQPTLV